MHVQCGNAVVIPMRIHNEGGNADTQRGYTNEGGKCCIHSLTFLGIEKKRYTPRGETEEEFSLIKIFWSVMSLEPTILPTFATGPTARSGESRDRTRDIISHSPRVSYR